MSVVAGIDFGTLSVRASIFDSQRGRLGSGIAPYPPHRKREDPDYATQSHSDHMRALLEAVMLAIASAGIDGRTVAAIAPDTTGSSVVPVGEKLEPLDDYYLWCDHRAWREAELITRTAEEMDVEAIRWCGGRYSSEWDSPNFFTGFETIQKNGKSSLPRSVPRSSPFLQPVLSKPS